MSDSTGDCPSINNYDYDLGAYNLARRKHQSYCTALSGCRDAEECV